ncbi:MAG: hypothetical protein ACFFD4_33025 [Candidatus Odinarchaeota archaeon]
MIDFDSLVGKVPKGKIEDYKFIHKLTLLKGKNVAFHRSDADGVVSAAIVKKAFPGENLVFIPISHEMLKMEDLGSYLANLEWFGIVDLPPFSKTRFELFSDHHRSTEGTEINAQTVLFNPIAPSAASLLAKHFHNIDDKTKELARLTEITDTAGYTIPPPLKINKIYSSEQERAWALNDLCKVFDSSRKIIELVERLSDEGFDTIPRRYNQAISKHRGVRRKSIELAKKLAIADLVILLFPDDSLNNIDMLHELFNRGAKVGVTFIDHQLQHVLSFRHSKILTEEERLDYRLDELAKQFGGGGHVSASGAEVRNYKQTLEKIIEWGKERGLRYKVYDLAERVHLAS